MKRLYKKIFQKSLHAIFLFSATLLVPSNNYAQIITTVAGNGTSGFNGDGGIATFTEFGNPSGIALDKAGNIYIADNTNNRIRKVDASNGIVSTVAGMGTPGFNGDGILATNAEIDRPWNLSLDAAGNIYIAGWGDNRVRKVTASNGYISTLAGNGTPGYNGDAILAVGAELNNPAMVVLDAAGNVYISDVNNQRVRKINTSGYISTVAGTGTAGYNGDGIMATNAELYNPNTITLDTLNNIYIADYYNNRIRKVTVSTGFISTVAGNGIGAFSGDGGQAISAELSYPTGMFFDPNENMYVSDYNNQRIREINTSGIISTIAGIGVAGYSGDGGTATSAEINSPWDITVTKNAFYIVEFQGNRVRKVVYSSDDINQVTIGIKAIVYPNPTDENLYIHLEGASGKVNLSLFNSIGQQVINECSSEETTKIQVANLSTGIYFLKILSADGMTSVQKISIVKN